MRCFFIRQLSRHLVGLWTAENPVAMNLLKRILVCVKFVWFKCLHTYSMPVLVEEDSIMI